MERYQPPGLVDDFARRPASQDALAAGWDAVIDSWLHHYADFEGGRFYNPRQDTAPGELAHQPVAWDAFPRMLEKWFEDDDEPDLRRWQASDTLRLRTYGGEPLRRVRDGSLAEPVDVFYRQLDEYCEWYVHRDADGHIRRITFTSEAPEYWRFLASGTRAFFEDDDERSRIVEGDMDLVTELYREHVDPAVTGDDLLWPYDVASYDVVDRKWYLYGRAGTYNPFNKWTTTRGSMHLTHPANTLWGEFKVAARAAVLRRTTDGDPVDDAEDVVCCSGFGDPNRSSDPTIGAAVNELVRDGLSVSLADPVGLYLAGINLDAFQGPDGGQVQGAWTVDRGDGERQMAVRATFAPPPGAVYAVDQMRASGTPIGYGGQVADEVQMILTGLAKRRADRPPDRQPCVTKCCEHPEKAGIETAVGPNARCSAVDWGAIAPRLEPPPGERLRSPAEQTGRLMEVEPDIQPAERPRWRSPDGSR